MPTLRLLLIAVTAAALLRLVDQGRLGLDDALARHLSDLPAAWSAVTVRHLLAHTSGLANHTQGGGLEKIRHLQMTPRELYASFRDAPLEFAPGTTWNYNNSGYGMAGLLIEKLSGKRYAEFVRAELLEPLGMTSSGVAHSAAIVPQLASGDVKEGTALRPAKFLCMSIPCSAGALYATSDDLLKWQRGLYGGALLSPASLKAMSTPQRNHDANEHWTPLVAESASNFYAPQVDSELRFELPASGPARSVTLSDLPSPFSGPWAALPLPSFTAQPVYLRGSMSRWSTDPVLTMGDDGLHRTTVDLGAGPHEFKVASADWATTDLGAAAQPEALPGRGSLVLMGADRCDPLATDDRVEPSLIRSRMTASGR